MNVSEAILEILADHGVEYIFGIPGDAINELIEAIRKQDRIRFIHVMHEESGAFAASAQAKLSGKLCACAGTAGPGAIHLLNGLYDAKMDHAPVIAITGQVETAFIGTAYQQEVNLQSLFEDVTVYNQTIYNAAQMPEIAVLACQTALSKNGVSHISIPIDISTQKVQDYEKKKQVIINHSRMRPGSDDLRQAADAINKSKKPCILAGIGCREAVPELLAVAELINAPVLKALRGKDILPDTHPFSLGGVGLLGTEPAFRAMKSCDLLLTIGSDFPYQDFYPEKGVTTIQIDREAHQIGRRHPADIPLTGDSKLTLNELLPLLINKTDDSFLRECQESMQKWLHHQDEKELSQETPIHPQALARTISDLASDDAVICCDTGTVTVWSARNFRIRGTQKFTLSGGLATMAVGLPSAIGAQLKYPHRQVIALCGDGGFAMLMCDFATAVKYNLNIKVFVFNNSSLSLIRIEEEAKAGNPNYETDLHNPDYAEYARICGGEGYTIKDPMEMKDTIARVLASDKPSVVNVFINPQELTWPPEITASEAFNYMKARITEYFTK